MIRTRQGDGRNWRADDPTRPETTGRYLVLLRHDGAEAAAASVFQSVGLTTFQAVDFRAAAGPSRLAEPGAVWLPNLGVAIVQGDPDQMGRLSIQSGGADSILAMEAERVVFAAGRSPRGADAADDLPSEGATRRDYLIGYREGVDHLVDRLLRAGAEPASSTLAPTAFSETTATWGLQVTGVTRSKWTGEGVRLAVLDTGFEAAHPDFVGRAITARSFVGGDSQDRQGHGTHCIGTACGALLPPNPPRYGVAGHCQIFAGKVLNDNGRGTDGDILQGIEWAIDQKCAIISMSLGAATSPGDRPSTVFENMARRALAAGTLIVAAASNESERPGFIAPVGHPANCPSIMAVAALDSELRVAFFSNGGIEPNGGQVDIAGPGVDVLSTWTLPRAFNTISGTSMAAPHVAGIAALHVQANPGISAVDLWTRLVKTARKLPLPARDVGSGLVQAP